MKIKIAGSNGYLGKIISDELNRHGHTTEGIPRELLYGPAEKLAGTLKNTDVVINLAGSQIIKRWSEKQKTLIINSRVETAKNITHAITLLQKENRPHKVITASGISIYAPGYMHTEESTNYDSGFLGEVTKLSESTWKKLPGDVELTLFRMAPVLGKKSHTLKKMYLPFIMGAGGKVGNGRQPFPFIHESDVAAAYLWATENTGTGGIYNLAAPGQINNEQFTRALANAMHRPAFLTVPAFILKLIYGQAAGLLVNSPAVSSEKLLQKGFVFKYENIEKTLQAIFS